MAKGSLQIEYEKLVMNNLELQEQIEKLRNLRDTVSINCNPPADCNDPKVLKTYMKACFDEAEKLYD